MKLITKAALFYLLPVTVFFSCAKPIDFKVSDDDKKIVLNGLIRSDSIIKINLSKSLGVLETDNSIEYIPDAKVKLYKGDKFTEDMSYISDGYYISSIMAESGKLYTIKANYENMPEAIGSTLIPELIPIEHIEFTYDTSPAIYQMYNHETQQYYDTIIVEISNLDVSVSFPDPPYEENYYFLTFTALKDVYTYNIFGFPEFIDTRIQSVAYDMENNINRENFLELNEERGYIINDDFFNGETYTINAQVDYDYEIVEPVIYINLYSVNKDLYNYAVSISKYDEAIYNPLAEPVNVISNIDGGFGFLSGCSLAQDSMIFNID